jgi:tetratricopeptide (TPR) repeat protein
MKSDISYSNAMPMSRILVTTLSLIGVLTVGCARWTGVQSPNYVTVEADSNHDTELARNEYKAARKCMQKQVDGKECDYAKAEKHLQDSLAADVRFGPAHHSLGILYFWQRKLYLAAWEFEYAARLMPDRFEPLNNLGLVYESAGKYEQAKSFYRLAREKAPNEPQIIGNLARTSFRNDEPVEQRRTVLEDILATDSRPEWRRWAAEQLGLNPVPSESPMPESIAPKDKPATLQLSNPTPASPPSSKQQPVEELPLIAPPNPGDAKPAKTSG